MTKRDLQTVAYEHLKNAIITNSYLPGQMIVEQDISDSLEISRTPVREALKRLESEGLVNHIPSVGTFVAQISVQDIVEIFQLRELFETTALKTAIIEASPEELERVESELFVLDDKRIQEQDIIEAYYRSDRHLHYLVLNYSRNSRMVSFYKHLETQVERLRRISSLTPMRLAKSRQEHLVIINAIRSRDLNTALMALNMHLENVKDSTISVCRSHIWEATLPDFSR